MKNLFTQRDKQGHFLVGAVFALIVSIFLQSPLAGFAFAILLGALKEFYDSFYPKQHTVDVFDFVATGLGGGVGAMLAWWIL